MIKNKNRENINIIVFQEGGGLLLLAGLELSACRRTNQTQESSRTSQNMVRIIDDRQ